MAWSILGCHSKDVNDFNNLVTGQEEAFPYLELCNVKNPNQHTGCNMHGGEDNTNFGAKGGGGN